jgi:hypothetical protein
VPTVRHQSPRDSAPFAARVWEKLRDLLRFMLLRNRHRPSPVTRTATAFAARVWEKLRPFRFMLFRNRCSPPSPVTEGQQPPLAGQSLGKVEGPLSVHAVHCHRPSPPRDSKRLWQARVWEKLRDLGSCCSETGAYRPSPVTEDALAGQSLGKVGGTSFGSCCSETGAYRPSPVTEDSNRLWQARVWEKVEGPFSFMLFRTSLPSVTSHRGQHLWQARVWEKSWRDLFRSCCSETGAYRPSPVTEDKCNRLWYRVWEKLRDLFGSCCSGTGAYRPSPVEDRNRLKLARLIQRKHKISKRKT